MQLYKGVTWYEIVIAINLPCDLKLYTFNWHIPSCCWLRHPLCSCVWLGAGDKILMVWVLTDAGSGAAAGYHPIIVLVSSSTPKKHRSSMVAMLFLKQATIHSAATGLKVFSFQSPPQNFCFRTFSVGQKYVVLMLIFKIIFPTLIQHSCTIWRIDNISKHKYWMVNSIEYKLHYIKYQNRIWASNLVTWLCVVTTGVLEERD